jgi:uncharacterized protein (UPF0332 family)
MDLMVKAFIDRANNELVLAEKVKLISEDAAAKEFLKIPERMTFYSSAISHSYYAIFYAAKAILMTKDIRTSSPEIHRKTFDEFKRNFVDTGILDVKLLEIYRNMAIRADELLEIFDREKWKRGDFTYNTIPQANRGPAEDSLRNANIFVTNIEKVIIKMGSR